MAVEENEATDSCLWESEFCELAPSDIASTAALFPHKP